MMQIGFSECVRGYNLAKGRLESARLRSRRLCHIDIKSFQEKSALATDKDGNSLSLAMQVNRQNLPSVNEHFGS
ncbi:hypothetical protein SAMN05421882_100377 [Nitrosomonas communis]|uniref:Uncharacterized protein n=1 Tax=Nitrosomonas communis TaxID=44574 RepID=A0A1H2QZI2_9PROT|nr:hypothetical protein SAMN05421882_100377 [Nitrosomonas communis]